MIVGTAGHIDHGKTALVRALTGVDADRLPEEKARGMTIDLGFAYRERGEGVPLGFVDVPGHERFVHTMLAGASGIDYVLLVVAADDGPMPQTVEHLHILDLLGLERGIVALNKADLVSAARLAEVEAQLRVLLAGTRLRTADILPVSALSGDGVAALQDRLLAAAADPIRHDCGAYFRLAIDRCFTLTGVGTVVTGTAAAGAVATGDRLCLTPSGIDVRVRSLHVHNRESAAGHAGQRCAVALAGSHLDRERIRRGDWLVDPRLHLPTQRLDIRLRLLESETRPLVHWAPVHLHLGAAHVPARAALLAAETLNPGAEGLAQLVTDRPVGALYGDRLILRDASARRTIGGGEVLDPWPPHRGRRHPHRLAILAALTAPWPHAGPAVFAAEVALRRLAAAGSGLIDVAAFARAWNLGDDHVADACRTAGLTLLQAGSGAVALAPERWAEIKGAIAEALREHHARLPQSPGLEAARLRLALPLRLPLAAWTVFVAQALGEGTIELDGAWLRLPGHAVRLSAADERLWARIRPLLLAGRFQPPRVRDYAATLAVQEEAVRQLLRRLAKMGGLVQIAPDHFFLRTTVAELAAIAGRLADGDPDGALVTAQFRDAIDTGRKVAIQILEFFDRAGVTVRRGERRTINRQNLHRFDDPRAGGQQACMEENVPGGAAGLQLQ